ncbi:MAG: ABC transporter permease [Treponema sp.]|jgi:spermidine/putrescine transport system permease protein|nr:ABC transporter permease [Treponema sp.]
MALHNKNNGPLYSSPMAVWFTLFFLAPIAIIAVYSFLKKGLHVDVQLEFTLDAYRSLSEPSLLKITMRTLNVSLIATVITIFAALPCGYFVARSKNQTVLLLLIIIPFWTNFLIRVFAWMNILGSNGFINTLLMRLNLINEYIPLMFNQKAVILVLVYMYLPYAILPLFATIDKFDFSLLEASRDLGASKFVSILKILLPNIKSGILTAVLFTFIPIFGAYAVPQLIGDMNSYMLGNYITDQIKTARNLPLASAISMVLTAATTIGVLVMMNVQRREASRMSDASKQADTARAVNEPEAAI